MKISVLALLLILSLANVVEAGCPIGDLNGDCEVNSEDLHVLAEQWLEPSGGTADYSEPWSN